ncbi:hypothetical protein DYE48_17905 [Halobacillus trueperi]|uniref:Uncharacterized protein n=1 Tax=Halobacillus trueperi TaxID=156205 RepID=A0A3E0J1V2_9BACI|nr:hypothetical protein DYE48_17905 [Halobacillus trueperi]
MESELFPGALNSNKDLETESSTIGSFSERGICTGFENMKKGYILFLEMDKLTRTDYLYHSVAL